MKLTVNGEKKNTDAKTVQKLLQSFDVEHGEKGVAVAVNDSVVPKDQWENYQLEEEDHIEIIRATQGG